VRWVMAFFCAAMWCSISPIFAQTAADPTLHRRAPASQPDKPAAAIPKARAGLSTLPPDASGEYLLDESGSVVQITLDAGKITGYVTRMGDERSDKDTPLTFFFDQCTVQGHQVSFTTRKVHGIWYSFAGNIVRGEPKITRDEDGYYRLNGSWTTHNDTRNSQSKEQVSLKSTPRQP
jgi:hypothetical protein